MNSIYSGVEFLRYNYQDNISPQLNRMTIPYLDITYVIEGELHYELNGESVAVHQGEAIIFPPHSVRYRYQSNARVRYCSFNVILPADFSVPIKGVVKNAFRSNTAYMLETVKKDSESISSNKTDKCISTFFYLYHQLLESAFDREINPHVKAIKQYINKHLFETITLDMISSDVHLVDRYLCTLFKKHTGMTVIEYINAERIDAAKKLIATNDIPLYKVAEECGFTDYNNFSRTFKKFTGTSPGDYKHNILKTYNIDNDTEADK